MKIGILISGRGSNMVALVDAVKSGEIPDSEVAVVISDKPSAAGLEKARERGVETLVIERLGRTREDHDAEMIDELRKREVELVCLAGYMRLLSKDFIHAFENRIVNIHPSLLPSFPGLDAQKQALEAGVKLAGCTVHYVNEDLDAGPIILQRWVVVEPGDTVDSLSHRILSVEHELYVESVRHLAIEANALKERSNFRRKYKVLKSIAHNLSHSFVSFTNYVDDGYVIDDLRQLVRTVEGNRITIDWIPGTEQNPGLTPRVLESIKWYKPELMRMVHNMGALMSSIKEFRTEIYLKKNKQIAVEGVLVDDRGRVYEAPVYDF
jgi:phosphoribosylglycinamide formyltransferase 1